jgi:xanthine dehydrogenase YagS FAD-binding subunit
MLTRFKHVNAASLEEASRLIRAHQKERARVISGGTDILRTIGRRCVSELPGILINLKTVADSAYIREEDGTLKIGALSKLIEIEESELTRGKWNLLSEACGAVGSPQIRNMATLAGSLCQDVCCWYYRAERNHYYCLRKGGKGCFARDGNNRLMYSIFGAPKDLPCYAVCQSDVAVALSALKAVVRTTQKTIPIQAFYSPTASGNVLGIDEIITEIEIPRPPTGTKAKYAKFGFRKALDHPLVSMACVQNREETRLVIGGVHAQPYNVEGVQDVVKGRKISEELARKVGELAVANAVPMSMNAWKVEVTRVLVQRTILDLA